MPASAPTPAFEVNGYFRTFAKWRQTVHGGLLGLVRRSVLNPCCKAYTHPYPRGAELFRYPPNAIVGPIIELRTVGPFRVATVYDNQSRQNVFVNVARGPTQYASPGWPNPDEVADAQGAAQMGRPAEQQGVQCRRCGGLIRSRAQLCARCWTGYCGAASTRDYEDVQCQGCQLFNWRWRHTCRHCGL